MNDYQIISNVTFTEEEIDDDDEESVFNQKPTTSYTKAKAILSKYIGWFETQEEAN